MFEACKEVHKSMYRVRFPTCIASICSNSQSDCKKLKYF